MSTGYSDPARGVSPDPLDTESSSVSDSYEGNPPLVSAAHVSATPPAARYLKPECVPERAVKRRKTSVTLDSEDASTTNRNILLPVDTLLSFIEDNFCCKQCRRVFKTKSVDDVPATDDQAASSDNAQDPHKALSLEIFGIACGTNFNCECGTAASLRPTLLPAAADKIKTLEDGKPYATRVNCGDFEINQRLILGLQLCGNGRHDASNIAGMLNLNVNPMKAKWSTTQESIGLTLIEVGQQIMEENLKIECAMSPVGVDGRSALDVCSDTRWDKRGSCRRYDSLSGCSVFIGLRSNLVIGIEAMSSVCIKCTNGIDHHQDVCPKNYTGSAKGMEAHGAAKILKRLFENENVRCYVNKLVTDDDSSVRKILTHSYQGLIDAGRMTEAEWPRYAKDGVEGKGQRKPDTGQLPLPHPEVEFLADHGHRNRTYSSKNFSEANKPKKSGCGMTKVDAERMKRRMSYTLKLHTGGTYEEFKKAIMAVLEHHFNEHKYCSDWCPSSGNKNSGVDVHKIRLRFQSKDSNKDMYEFMKKHHEEFMQEDKLKQLYHLYDTQKVEGFNKLLTKLLHKDKTYCQTIENKAHIHLAVGLQSVGYADFYKRVFAIIGVSVAKDDVTSLFFGSEDIAKLGRQWYRQKPSVKVRRMRDQFKKIRGDLEKLKKDNEKDLSYETGMMGPGGERERPRKKTSKRAARKEVICKHCGLDDHQMITSKKCKLHPKYVPAEGKMKKYEEPSTKIAEA